MTRVNSSLPRVSMMKWARRLFSASDIWRERMASKLGLRHARPGQNARALDRFRRAHHDHQINARFPAGLKQQWHVDDDEPPAGGRRALDKLNARLSDSRMHKTFKAPQRVCVAQHPRSKALAIDLP